jgi:hypothetical protein
MKPKIFGWLLFLAALSLPARAVENYPAGTTDTDSTGYYGANYVGQVGGASGVYLGNGYVLTAAHVGYGTFVLNNEDYTVANIGEEVAPGVDLYLFQINTTPDLPSTPLTLALMPPVPESSSVEMIGYGVPSGPQMETYGTNVVNASSVPTPLTVGTTSYDSMDFYTFDGVDGNTAQLIVGDSGGGDFTYDSMQGWVLTGINEAESLDMNNNPNGSAMVEISDYAGDIDGLMAVPEPPPWLLLGLGFGVVGAWTRFRPSRTA